MNVSQIALIVTMICYASDFFPDMAWLGSTMQGAQADGNLPIHTSSPPFDYHKRDRWLYKELELAKEGPAEMTQWTSHFISNFE